VTSPDTAALYEISEKLNELDDVVSLLKQILEVLNAILANQA
jgi:hypothetical protein